MDSFRKLRIRVASFMAGFIIFIVPLSDVMADDTEIFYVGETVRPKILMILDTSLSMSADVSDGKSRLTNMKEAMRDFINDSEDSDIGLVRMNQISGAVIFPISNLSDTIPETYTTLSRPVTENHNNAMQKNDGTVVSHPLRLTQGKLGFRFENIAIDNETTITSAYLTFVPNFDCIGPCSNFTMTIQGEMATNSSEFTPTNHNVSNRKLGSKKVLNTVSGWAETRTLKTDNLKSIIQPIISQGQWKAGNALSLIITPNLTNNQINGAYKNRRIYSAKDRYSPVLTLNFNPYTRDVLKKDKLLEILDDQKLTFRTPVVPALWEGIKYLQGQALIATQVNTVAAPTTRNAPESSVRADRDSKAARLYELDKMHERIAVDTALIDNTYTKHYPPGCNTDDTNLNDEACKGVTITSPTASPHTVPMYKSPLGDTCNGDEASIILLADGGTDHKSGSDASNKWWGKLVSEINTMDGVSCSISDSTKMAQTCGVELATKLRDGIDIAGLTEKKKISLYTIGFNNNDSFLTLLANQGQTSSDRYRTASNSAGLLSVFNAIKNDILAKTVTFSNSAASVNSSNRLSHNNVLYFPLFEPSHQASWFGNLKKYSLGGNGQIYAQNKKIAINPATGEFNEDIRDLWLPIHHSDDGEDVLLGGAASKLPSSRTIWVNTATETLTQLTTASSEFVPTDFDTSDNTDKNTIINKMIRATKLGDPLHSTPIVVNYLTNTTGSVGSTDPIVYYGDNHGYIHAIRSSSGLEEWAFMPKQLLLNQKDIQTNSDSQTHIYGMDGELTKWQTKSKIIIYSGMRRGGFSYYALDVTRVNSPKLLWEISNQTPGFEKLGQTWSTPVKTRIKHNSMTREVLIFGGGYDTQQDTVTVKTKDSVGNAIYIVDAESGERLQTITHPKMKYSIPSDVKVINIDNDSEHTADQIYVGDMGGQVFRVDIASNGDISVGVIAALAKNTTATNRRFYHAPDVSLLANTGQSTLAIAIGSGYRAHPKNIVNQDRFYMIEQPLHHSGNTPSYTTITESNLYDATDNDLGSANDTSAKAAYIARSSKQGWYIKLSATEKSLASSLTFDDAIWFTTYKPATNSANCSNRNGEARIYRINASNATPDYKGVFPKVLDNSGLDESTSCNTTQCGVSDRSQALINTILPPRPSLLNIKGKRLIGIGTEFYPAATNKTKRMFWTEK